MDPKFLGADKMIVAKVRAEPPHNTKRNAGTHTFVEGKKTALVLFFLFFAFVVCLLERERWCRGGEGAGTGSAVTVVR